MKIPKSIALWFLALAVLAGAGAAKASDDSEKMLVILTSPEVETQAMALVLSNHTAMRGTKVRLLLCGPAGDIALKTPPAQAQKVVTPKGMTVSSLLAALRQKGAAVEVCAIYLPNRNLAPDALAEGVGVARPPAIAAEMTDDDTQLAVF